MKIVTLTDEQHDELCSLIRFCGPAFKDLLKAVENDARFQHDSVRRGWLDDDEPEPVASRKARAGR